MQGTVRALTASRYGTLFLAGLFGALLGRFILVGAVRYVGIPVNIDENFGPLYRLLLDGRSIEQLGPRQYGAVAFMVIDPLLRLFGRDPFVLNMWMLFLGVTGIAAAFALVARRYDLGSVRALLLLGILWAGFLPLIDALANRLFDLPVLGLIAAGLFCYTGGRALARWGGVAIGVAFLTKLLPAIFLPLQLIREPRAFAYGAATVAALLVAGQLLYGQLMGLGYPLYLLTSTPDTTFRFSFQGENNSLRGLLFKVAAGFRTAPGGQVAAVPNAQLLHYAMLAIAAGLVAYLLYVVFRHRAADGLRRRSVEFALATVTMYLVAPLATHEHMVAMVLVFTILWWLWRSAPELRSRWLAGLAGLALFLIGVYLPASLIAGALRLDSVMRGLGNESSEFFGYPIAEYNFLGFPGLGLILAWIVLVVLERRTRRPVEAP